jgi:hypothetical protein
MATTSIMIPIPQTNNFIHKDKNNRTYLTNLENTPQIPRYNVELNKNFFDPSKSSPPNEFMEKLNKRMDIYNNTYSTVSSSPILSAHYFSLFMQSSSEKKNDSLIST